MGRHNTRLIIMIVHQYKTGKDPLPSRNGSGKKAKSDSKILAGKKLEEIDGKENKDK